MNGPAPNRTFSGARLQPPALVRLAASIGAGAFVVAPFLRSPILFAACILSYIVVRIYRSVRRLTQFRLNGEAESIAARDDFCLFLRPFLTAGQLSVGNLMPERRDRWLMGNQWDIEFALAWALAHTMDLIAIGQSPRALGAAKLSTTEENWKSLMLELSERARVIVIVPLARPSTLWEAVQVFNQPSLLRKTIFAMPPKRFLRLSTYKWRRLWAESQKSLLEENIRLPDYDPSGGLFLLSRSASVRMEHFNFDPLYISTLFAAVADAGRSTLSDRQVLDRFGLMTFPRSRSKSRLYDGAGNRPWPKIESNLPPYVRCMLPSFRMSIPRQ